MYEFWILSPHPDRNRKMTFIKVIIDEEKINQTSGLFILQSHESDSNNFKSASLL